MGKKKIAIVNQRYGVEVNGGSEYYTRLIAKKLNEIYHVEVLTTCALDYIKWDNYYAEGIQTIEGVKIIRFPTEKKHVLYWKFIGKLLRMFHKPPILFQKIWVNEQGPKCPELLKYIVQSEQKYDVFIFITYLYYPVVFGMEKVKNKAIFIPTAHDEPYIYFNIYKSIFHCPRAIIYLTEEEKNFVQRLFQNENIVHDVIGVGIDDGDIRYQSNYIDRYGIHDEYFVYAGRVDSAKNCNEMFQYFVKYKNKHTKSNLKLIIIGNSTMHIPSHKDIKYLGFVSDMEKKNIIAGAKFLWMPSLHESLSIVALEAMGLSVPIIVNSKCSVLCAHCRKSNGGIEYNNYFELENKLEACSDEAYCSMKRNARNYINKYYTWENILCRMRKLIEEI